MLRLRNIAICSKSKTSKQELFLTRIKEFYFLGLALVKYDHVAQLVALIPPLCTVLCYILPRRHLLNESVKQSVKPVQS